MAKIDIPKGALAILDRLYECGEEAYVVGGCVRDTLMGREPHDWDICTSATPELVKDIFCTNRTIDTGLKHGTVSILDETGETYEVTTYRVENGYSDGRHPDSVHFVSDLREDLARRDFTMNAMAYNDRNRLIDPFGGEEDIAHEEIRCVGDAKERFTEDALRILRAVRFSAQLGFSIEENTSEAMRSCMDGLDKISAERIGNEFLKIICAKNATYAICNNKPVLCKIVPELAPLIGCQQNNRYHNTDVFGHTVQAMWRARNPWKLQNNEFPMVWTDSAVCMALFFHDFGKPAAKTTDEDGHDHFYGHPAISAGIAEKVMSRLRFSNYFKDMVVELVAHHDVEFMPNKRCVRRMLNKFGVNQLHRLLKIRECDNWAHSPAARPLFQERVIPFATLLEEVLEEQSAFSLKDLAINGRDLINVGVKPGPEIGRLLNMALDAVIDEKIENKKQPLLEFLLA